MDLLAVFCLSFSSLCFEITLTRMFSLGQGNHLAFLAVGIAMLGSAAGGVLYARIAKPWRILPLGPICLAAQASMLLAFLGARAVPLDYLRFPIDPLQYPLFLADALLLSLPFLACGLGTCAAYDAGKERSGALALASMAGSGAGAAAPALLFPLLGEGPSLVAASASLLVPAAAWAARARSRDAQAASSAGAAAGRGSARAVAQAASAGATGAAALACALLLLCGRGLGLPLSEYSSLSQALRLPLSRVVEERFGIRGRIDLVDSPAYRMVPGLSLAYGGEIPGADLLMTDGDQSVALYDMPTPRDAAFARSTVGALGYALAPPRPRVDLVVDDPEAAAFIRDRYKNRITCIAEDARAFFARTEEAFDLVEIEDWGASLPGMESLSVGYRYTIEAFRSYWSRLSRDGAVVVSRRVLLPPGDILRLFSSARAALEAEGIAEPERNIAVARGWDACALMVSRSAIEGARLGALREAARELSLDLDWFPGISDADVNLFNRFERPWHYEALRATIDDPDFARDYPLDAAAQGDDRPFPSKLAKWTRMREYYESTGARPYVLLLSGEASILGMLGAALAAALPLVLAPALAARRKAIKPRAASIALFAAIGAGFIFTEMAFLDGLALVWENPSVCLAVALAGMLAFSGAGGLATRRIGGASLKAVLALAAAAVAAAALYLGPAAALALRLPDAAAIPAVLAIVAAPSFLAGAAFPAAMRLLPSGSVDRGLSWAANGAASVVASVLAAPIAMSLGIRALALASALAYGAAALLAPRGERRPGSTNADSAASATML